MTANQITWQDLVELVKESMKFTTNMQFSKTRVFRDFCSAFEIEPTKRQASKFRRNTGRLYENVAQRIYGK